MNALIRTTLACIVFAAFLAGCATAGIETRATLTDDTYRSAGRKDRNAVEVFEDESPSKPYREIAKVLALGTGGSTKSRLVTALQRRAAEIGADALVGLSFSAEPVKGGPVGGMVCPTWMVCTYLGGSSVITSRPVAQATAIVYTTEDPPAAQPTTEK